MLDKLKGRDHIEDINRWEDNIKVVLKQYDVRMCTGSSWLGMGSSGRSILWNLMVLSHFPL